MLLLMAGMGWKEGAKLVFKVDKIRANDISFRINNGKKFTVRCAVYAQLKGVRAIRKNAVTFKN